MDYLIFRISSALLSGMILSQAGSLIQMSSRNLLASPSTLGFDGLAVLWVLIFNSILLLFNWDGPVAYLLLAGIPVFIFIGWIYSLFMQRQQRMERLILIGLTFNLFVGAIFSLWQFFFMAFNLPFPVELWFGHFRFATSESSTILLLMEIFLMIGWFRLKREFILFSLGEAVAGNLKFNERRIYLFIFIAIALGTFAVVGLFGAFSFLGLIFPIIARKLWFIKFDLDGEFLLGSCLNGIFLMLIDLVCYFFPIYGAEVPVGLIATAVGAVSLIGLLWKRDNLLEILAKRQ